MSAHKEPLNPEAFNLLPYKYLNGEAIFSKADVQKFFGWSNRTMERNISNGRIVGIKIGAAASSLDFRQQDLDRYMGIKK